MDNRLFNNETLLSELTIGEFKDLVVEVINQSIMPKRLVSGLDNIAAELGVSKTTVKRLKNGILKGAFAQSGHTIIADINKAHDLMSRRNRKQS